MKRLIKDILVKRRSNEQAKSRSARVVAETRQRQEEEQARLAVRARRRGPVPRIFH